jgi:hypothetical protein
VDGPHDTVRIEQVVRREAVPTPRLEHRRGGVEGDRVGEAIRLDISPDLIG